MMNTSARDQAVSRTSASNSAWVFAVVQIIRRMSRGRIFTTDDLWEKLAQDKHRRPTEPRAMGAAIVEALREELIDRQGYRISRRATCHHRPLAVWRRV